MHRAALAKIALAGFQICGASHDSVMALIPVERLEQDTAAIRSIMERTSLSFTRGLRIRVSHKVVMPGERLVPVKPGSLFSRLLELLAQIEAEEEGLRVAAE